MMVCVSEDDFLVPKAPFIHVSTNSKQYSLNQGTESLENIAVMPHLKSTLHSTANGRIRPIDAIFFLFALACNSSV